MKLDFKRIFKVHNTIFPINSIIFYIIIQLLKFYIILLKSYNIISSFAVYLTFTKIFENFLMVVIIQNIL